MKEAIHPNYYVTSVGCACGNTFTTRSTRKDVKLDICGACHPFYSGKQRMLDTAGVVERFQKRFAKTGGATIVRKPTTDVKKRLAPEAPAEITQKVISTAPRREFGGKDPKAPKAPKAAKDKKPAKA